MGYNMREIFGAIDPDTHPASALEPILTRQQGETHAYSEAFKAFARKTNAATGNSDYVRLNSVLGLTQIVAAQATGKRPGFLAADLKDAGERRISLNDRAAHLNNRMAEILAQNRHELRAFTVEEFGNKALSPYRDKRPAAQAPEQDRAEDDYVALSQKYVDSLRVKSDLSAPPIETLSPNFQ
jgi:hypothetical protein